MWTAAGPNPHLVSRLGLASQPSGGLGDSPRPGRTACQVWKGLSVRQPAPLRPTVPTQKLVEGVGDRVIPAALEEGQASWSHGFLVFLVEIKSVEGPLGKLIAVRWGECEWGGDTRAPHPLCPIGDPEGPLRARLAQPLSARLKS